MKSSYNRDTSTKPYYYLPGLVVLLADGGHQRAVNEFPFVRTIATQFVKEGVYWVNRIPQ